MGEPGAWDAPILRGDVVASARQGQEISTITGYVPVMSIHENGGKLAERGYSPGQPEGPERLSHIILRIGRQRERVRESGDECRLLGVDLHGLSSPQHELGEQPVEGSVGVAPGEMTPVGRDPLGEAGAELCSAVDVEWHSRPSPATGVGSRQYRPAEHRKQ